MHFVISATKPCKKKCARNAVCVNGKCSCKPGYVGDPEEKGCKRMYKVPFVFRLDKHLS